VPARASDVRRPNSPEHPVHRVGVGEHVVRRLPVAVLVGVSEARDPQRRRVGERSSESGGSGAGADRFLERLDDSDGIVSEQLCGKRCMIRPAPRAGAGGERAP
jgi:hypothetical protein